MPRPARLPLQHQRALALAALPDEGDDVDLVLFLRAAPRFVEQMQLRLATDEVLAGDGEVSSTAARPFFDGRTRRRMRSDAEELGHGFNDPAEPVLKIWERRERHPVATRQGCERGRQIGRLGNAGTTQQHRNDRDAIATPEKRFDLDGHPVGGIVESSRAVDVVGVSRRPQPPRTDDHESHPRRVQRAADALGKDRSWRNGAGIAKHGICSKGKLQPLVELIHRIHGIRAAVADEDTVRPCAHAQPP